MKKDQEKEKLKFENDEFYADSNFFIFAFANPEEDGERARKLLESVKKGELKIYTSYLTLDEVMWIIQHEKNKEESYNCAKIILSTPNIIFIEVNQEIISNSIDIYNKEKLDPRDAIHLASMQSKKIKTIVTTDSDFDKIKEIKRVDFRR